MENSKKSNRRIRMTKQMIQQSFIELLEKKPIEKITIRELCNLADIKRTTFYNHYGSQYDVLNEIGEQFAYNIVLSSTAQPDSTPLPLSVQVTEICRYLQLHSQEARILLTHFNADDSIIQTILASRISAESVQYADYTHIYDEDARKLLNRFLSHGIYNLIRCWLLDEINKTPEDIGALTEDIALHGWIKSSD